MGFTMRFTARGVRETERPVSFIPKGALTHHLQSKRWYACGIVRSPRGMRLLRKPYGQCHISGSMLSLSTQSAKLFCYLQNKAIAKCAILCQLPAKTCHRQLYRRYGRLYAVHFLFAKKKQNTRAKGR